MGVFHELLGEKWPQDIGSALYNQLFMGHLITVIEVAYQLVWKVSGFNLQNKL